jgi:hypothetical protein
MPGPRYRHVLTAGPYQGEDCRIIEQDTDRHYFKVRLRQHFRHRGDPRPPEFFFPIEWVSPKNGDSVKRKRGQK